MSGFYDVTLAPGASAQIPARGGFCKVTSAASGAVQVKLDGGEGYSLMEGTGIRLPDGQYFRDVQVKNLAALAQTIILFIGDTRFEDTRVTGTVRVIDQSVDKTNLGLQFAGSGTNGRVLGKINLVGIKPGTRSAIIKRLFVSSTTAGQVNFYRATGDATVDFVNSGSIGVNKLIGGAVGQAAVLIASTAAAGPTGVELPGVSGFVGLFIAANTPTEVPLTTPIVIAGVNQLYASGQVADRIIGILVDMEEA